jgi:hypothetical protein
MKIAEIVKMADRFVKMTKRSEIDYSEWEPLLKDEGWKDQLRGGRADKCVPSDFDKEQLIRGAIIEFEHTNDKTIALEIAQDHLSADPNYYRKL